MGKDDDLIPITALPGSNRAVFLDRDGVINEMVYNPDYGLVDSPANADEFKLLPGVGEAITKIRTMGFLTIIVSNQPGLAKGRFSLALHQAITNKMHIELAKVETKLDAVYYCLHHPDAKLDEYRTICECRKPKPGMLLKASQDLNINLSGSYFIGDGITDVAAGQAAGTKTFLVGSSKLYVLHELDKQRVYPDYFTGSLNEAVKTIEFLENHHE